MPAIDPLIAFAIFLLIFSIGQTMFASLLLLVSKRGHKPANRYMAAFMLCMCCTLSLFALFDFWRIDLPHTTLVYQPFVFLMPPLLWCYLVSITSSQHSPDIKAFLPHSIPAIVVCVLLAPFYQLPAIEKIEWVYILNTNDPYIVLSDVQAWVASINPLIKWAVALQGFIYSLAAYLKLRKHRKNIENEFSYMQDIDLRWFVYLLLSCALLYAAYAITLTANHLGYQGFTPWIVTFCSGGLLLSVFGYFGVRQESIFVSPQPEKTVELTPKLVSIVFSPEGVEQKYKSSALSEENVDECYAELLNYMSASKPYTNCELSIRMLAEKLQLPARELSRVINEKSGKNFMEFINMYRIDEAKKTLKADNDLKILDISLMSGFNSKSSFYDAFKKFTSMTPSEYKKHKLLKN